MRTLGGRSGTGGCSLGAGTGGFSGSAHSWGHLGHGGRSLGAGTV